MKEITFLVQDDDLIEVFKQQRYFTGFKNYRKLKDITEEVDILVVSEDIVSKEDILEIELQKTPSFVFYLFSDGRGLLSNVQKFKEKGIITLPINATKLCTYNFICKDIVPNFEFENNVFTFYGADSKVGTTMVAQSVAEFIAENTELKVLTIFLSGKSSDYYVNVTNPPTLDILKTKLFSEILSDTEVMHNCVKVKDNLYMLFGISMFLERRQYEPKHIETLFKIIKSNFDCVIVDAGSYVELGCTLGAIHETNHRYLVTNTSLNTLNDYTDLRQQVLNRLKVDSAKLVINKYGENEVYSGDELSKLYCSEFLCNIPLIENSLACEYEKKTLLSFEDKEYNTAIEIIINDILGYLNVKYERTYVEKKSLFSFLGGVKWLK